MFGFGKGDVTAAIESELTSLQQREARLRSRAASAETELLDARARRRAELIEDGDDDDGPVLSDDNVVSAIEAKLVSLNDALAELGARRTAAEAKLAQARDQAARQATAKMMADAHARIQTAFDANRKATAELVGALGAVSAGAALAGQYGGFIAMFAGEVVALLRQLETHRETLLRGAVPLTSVAITESTSAAIASPAPIERVRVFTAKQIRWTDDGPKTAVKYAIVELPTAAARRALAIGAVLAADDARVGKLVDGWGRTGIQAHGPTISLLPAHECVDCDAPIAEVAA